MNSWKFGKQKIIFYTVSCVFSSCFVIDESFGITGRSPRPRGLYFPWGSCNTIIWDPVYFCQHEMASKRWNRMASRSIREGHPAELTRLEWLLLERKNRIFSYTYPDFALLRTTTTRTIVESKKTTHKTKNMITKSKMISVQRKPKYNKKSASKERFLLKKENSLGRPKNWNERKTRFSGGVIGNFRVHVCLLFKASLSVKFLLWKLVFIHT